MAKGKVANGSGTSDTIDLEDWRPPKDQRSPKRPRTGLPALGSAPKPLKWNPQDRLAAVTGGLGKREGKPKRVIIVGAGIAGLAAAELLQDAGHEVLILEGQQRVGGRIYTVREGLAPGLFAEMGAMRIPEKHDLTMAYVKKFGLKTDSFTMDNPETRIHLQGLSSRRKDFTGDAQGLDFGLTAKEKRLHPDELLRQALRPLTSLVDKGGDKARKSIEEKYDQYSVARYLRECANWSQGAIEMFGLLKNAESRMNYSFVEFFHHEYSSTFKSMVYLTDGMDSLPNAFLCTLKDRIRFGAVMQQIWEFDDKVTVVYRSDRRGLESVEADYLIVTIPFSLMRHVMVLPRLSQLKARAIRQVNYDASSKIFMQFSHRFWEDEGAGIRGGGTITDMSIRNVFYPDHGRETGRGALLASYTWGRDSTYLANLPRPHLIQLVLQQLHEIHGVSVDKFYEVSVIHHWGLDRFAGGVGVLLLPTQYKEIFDHIGEPERRIHFAGDHCSRYDTRWIQGALESAIQTAYAVHKAPAPTQTTS